MRGTKWFEVSKKRQQHQQKNQKKKLHKICRKKLDCQDAHVAHGHMPHMEDPKIKQSQIKRLLSFRKRTRIRIVVVVVVVVAFGRRLSSSWYGITTWPTTADRHMSLVGVHATPRSALSWIQYQYPEFAAICTRKTSTIFAHVGVIKKQWAYTWGTGVFNYEFVCRTCTYGSDMLLWICWSHRLLPWIHFGPQFANLQQTTHKDKRIMAMVICKVIMA